MKRLLLPASVPLTRLVFGAEPPDDLALQPAHVIRSPWKQHVPPTKRQGVRAIERTAKGRLSPHHAS
jgi:hypothetical protein